MSKKLNAILDSFIPHMSAAERADYAKRRAAKGNKMDAGDVVALVGVFSILGLLLAASWSGLL